MSRFRVSKVESRVHPDPYDQYPFSELRDTVFGEIIESRLDNVARRYCFQIFDNRLDRKLVICGKQPLYILCYERFRAFRCDKITKISIKATSSSIEPRPFPNYRKVLTGKTADNKIRRRYALVGERIYFRDVFADDVVTEGVLIGRAS